jgi:hypothetical protein
MYAQLSLGNLLNDQVLRRIFWTILRHLREECCEKVNLLKSQSSGRL